MSAAGPLVVHTWDAPEAAQVRESERQLHRPLVFQAEERRGFQRDDADRHGFGEGPDHHPELFTTLEHPEQRLGAGCLRSVAVPITDRGDFAVRSSVVAFAGALDVRLGGHNYYHGAIEDRGFLGDGRPVEIADIARARRLAAAVSISALAVAVLFRGWRS